MFQVHMKARFRETEPLCMLSIVDAVLIRSKKYSFLRSQLELKDCKQEDGNMIHWIAILDHFKNALKHASYKSPLMQNEFKLLL